MTDSNDSKISGVVQLLKLGEDQVLVAKLDKNAPAGEYDIQIDMKPVSDDPDAPSIASCGVRCGLCCRRLSIS